MIETTFGIQPGPDQEDTVAELIEISGVDSEHFSAALAEAGYKHRLVHGVHGDPDGTEDKPMQTDLSRLGRIQKIMEENGLDLHGSQQQAYIDASTGPPTYEFFHHTNDTFRYVPPTVTAINHANEHPVDPHSKRAD